MMPVAWDLISRGLMPIFPPKRSKKGSQEVTAIMKEVTSMQKKRRYKMRQYTYFPGCAMASTGKPIQTSLDSVTKVLDIELKELEDWTCCGCPGESINELAATAIATRNLALAEKTNLDMVVPCSCCYRNLLAAHVTYTQDPRIREQVKKALAANQSGI